MSPTLNVNPTLFVIPCKFYGDNRFTMLQLLSLTKRFFYPNLNHPWQYFIRSWSQEKIGFGQWMNSSIIHDNICSLSQKKYHPKNNHTEIQYHITLNIIFSVLLIHSLTWSLLILLTFCKVKLDCYSFPNQGENFRKQWSWSLVSTMV